MDGWLAYQILLMHYQSAGAQHKRKSIRAPRANPVLRLQLHTVSHQRIENGRMVLPFPYKGFSIFVSVWADMNMNTSRDLCSRRHHRDAALCRVAVRWPAQNE